MKYLLYEIKNNINGKIYVGVHKTKVLDDGYMGSGKILKRAILKYGKENFTKTILETFDSHEEMYKRESELVNKDFLARIDVYNLRNGGSGGFDYVNKLVEMGVIDRPSIQGAKAFSEKMKTDPIFRKRFSDTKSADSRKRIKNGYLSPFATNPEFREKGLVALQTEEIKLKRRLTFSTIEHQQGKNNSQFGFMWITDGTVNRKIKKEDLVPEGWAKGRV